MIQILIASMNFSRRAIGVTQGSLRGPFRMLQRYIFEHAVRLMRSNERCLRFKHACLRSFQRETVRQTRKLKNFRRILSGSVSIRGLKASFCDIKHILFLRQRYHFHHTLSQDKKRFIQIQPRTLASLNRG